MCENQKHAEDVDLDQIADDTHGFVGADLANLASKAAVACIRREALHIIDWAEEGECSFIYRYILRESCSQFDSLPLTYFLLDWAEEDIPPDFIAKLRVTASDFAKVMVSLSPSATRDVQVSSPTTSFADIGGLAKVKEELKEMVSAPVKYRHYYADIGVEPPRGALMYGPPGVGKTMLAKAMANECSANFISIKGPQVRRRARAGGRAGGRADCVPSLRACRSVLHARSLPPPRFSSASYACFALLRAAPFVSSPMPPPAHDEMVRRDGTERARGV